MRKHIETNRDPIRKCLHYDKADLGIDQLALNIQRFAPNTICLQTISMSNSSSKIRDANHKFENSPVQPMEHLHVNLPSPSKQTPLFWHGFGKQSSMSAKSQTCYISKTAFRGKCISKLTVFAVEAGETVVAGTILTIHLCFTSAASVTLNRCVRLWWHATI